MTTEVQSDNSIEYLHGVGMEPWVDPRLRAGLSLQRPLLVAARQSPPICGKTAQAVARDAIEMVEVLHATLGIYLRDIFPLESVLAQALASSTDQTPSKEFGTGVEFTNTFAEIDLRPQGIALVIFLSAGTGSKLDTNRQQPFINRLADRTGAIKPILLFTKTPSRRGRQGWGQAPLQAELQLQYKNGQRVYVGTKHGIEDIGSFADAQRLLEGSKSLDVAVEMKENTRRTMITLTGRDTVMREGSFNYHLGGAMPPGLVRLALRTTIGSGRRKRAFLDCPKAWPDQRDVVTQLPSVIDDDGNPASQVENIRWLLAHAGRYEWPAAMLNAEMKRRGFSTQSLRDVNGASARFGHTKTFTPITRAHPVFKNLELYETGVMRRMVGNETVTATGIFPLDGDPWAQPEDFHRLRQWLKRGHQALERRVFYTFSMMRLVVNGIASRLRPTATSHLRSATDCRYTFQRADLPAQGAEPGKPGRTAGRPDSHLLHEWIAESIIDAIATAGLIPLPAVHVEKDDPELAVLRSQRAAQATLIAASETALKNLGESLVEMRTDGTHVIPQEERVRLWDVHLAQKEEIEQLKAALGQLDAAVAHRVERVERLARGLEVSALLDVLASLRDPSNTTYRTAWLQAISDFTVTVTPQRHRGHSGTHIAWEFMLRLSSGSDLVDVKVTGERVIGALARADERVGALISDLRAGIPTPSSLKARALLPTVRERLSLPESASQVLCPHPPLLRLHMRIIDALAEGQHIDSDWVAKTARIREFKSTFSAPASLIRHLMRTYYSEPMTDRKWRKKVGPTEVEALKTAWANNGLVTNAEVRPSTRTNLRISLRRARREDSWVITEGALRLNPCRRCGSYILAAPRLREMRGYVCTECRYDEAGVRWSSDFDSALTPLPPEPLAPSTTPTGVSGEAFARHNYARYRDISELEHHERVDLIRRYSEGGETLRPLARDFNLSFDSARKAMAEAGVLRARGRRGHGGHG